MSLSPCFKPFSTKISPFTLLILMLRLETLFSSFTTKTLLSFVSTDFGILIELSGIFTSVEYPARIGILISLMTTLYLDDSESLPPLGSDSTGLDA